MGHDANFLAKCEEFLLHPTVRSLSLAQRVDFLEHKGLTPEEITTCLKSIEEKNGLSRTFPSTTTKAGQTKVLNTLRSKRMWWKMPWFHYGASATIVILLAYGYVRFRHYMINRLLLAHRQTHHQRRIRTNERVAEMLRAIKEQQSIYEKTITRVKQRINALQTTRETTKRLKEQEERTMRASQQSELTALQEQVKQLQCQVLTAYKRTIDH